MKRGEVWIANLAPRSGSEQKGKRPVLVVSNDGFNRTPTWRSVIVVPFTTSGPQSKRGPTAIPIRAGQGGLSDDSTALCHQITTLSRDKLKRHIGELGQVDLQRIGRGLMAALALE
jgi:mRNA interferase MazF